MTPNLPVHLKIGRLGGGSLAGRMKALGIHPDDLEFSFSRASGPGGQHVNKVSTAVCVTHLPSGLAARASDSRSQHANRVAALERLLAAMEAAVRQAMLTRRAQSAKTRRQKARRSPAKKARILEGKRRRSTAKSLRKKVAAD